MSYVRLLEIGIVESNKAVDNWLEEELEFAVSVVAEFPETREEAEKLATVN